MEASRIEYLFHKYIRNLADEDDHEELGKLMEIPENELIVQDLLHEFMSAAKPGFTLPPESGKIILQSIFREQPGANVFPMKSRINWRQYLVAASVLLAVVLGSYFLLRKNNEIEPLAKQEIVSDITPGHEGAILTLADGRKITLDSTVNGVIAQQGNSNVVKQENGLSYQAGSKQEAVVYNMVTTPFGRQYSLILEDGSKVWLNAGSSIRFPSAFLGDERRVEIAGEVYFEVVKNASQPFRVIVKDMTVEVLGTHFNINSYSDEDAIRTTLLEGAVKVIKDNKAVQLSPGQQSVLNPSGSLTVYKGINTEETIAWKEGNFHFESADLKTILRQFARWYDVQVVYEGEIPDDKYFVIVKRSSTLLSVLKALQSVNIRFKIEGKKLFVQPS